MLVRVAVVVVACFGAAPAIAEELGPEQAARLRDRQAVLL